MPRWFTPAAGLTAMVLLAGCTTSAASQPSPSLPPPAAVSTPATPSPSATPTRTPTPTPRPSPSVPVDRRRGGALDQPFTVDGLPVVSRKHPVSAAHRPADPVPPYGLTAATQRALARLKAAATRAGVRLVVKSAYRSYATQASILRAKIREYGDEALARRYNAAPGRSEHQTGLAVDLYDGVTWGVGVRNTRTGRWLWANAWRYGFILRYPNGKEAITGYAFEPWHFRYVGVDHSRRFGANSRLTLEEYLHLA